MFLNVYIPCFQRLMGSDGMTMVNGTTGLHGEEEYWTEGGVSVSQLQGRPSSPQAPSLPQGQAPTQRQVSEHYSNTLPVRRPQPAKNKTSVGETRTLPRSSSMAAGLEKNGRARVQAIFSHAAGDNSTLLSFSEGDVITLLVPEARDGWHYGENEKNKMRGWFPFSYTRVLPESEKEKLQVNLHHGKSSSTGNLLESDMSLPMPDYGLTARLLAQSLAQSRPRPYSMAGFTTQPALEDYDSRFAAASDRALEIYFRQPINDDRSAPIFY